MKTYNHRNGLISLAASIMYLLIAGGCSPMSKTYYDATAGINGSFEATRSGLPVNWLLYTPETVKTGDFDIIIDTSEFKEGKQSLKFAVRECSATGGWHSPGLSKEYEARPGDTYVVSFWVKNNGCRFFIQIGGVSAFDGKYETIIKSDESIETWKYFEHKYTMPTEEKFGRIRFELSILSKGSFWIDGIKIVGSDGKSVIPSSR